MPADLLRQSFETEEAPKSRNSPTDYDFTSSSNNILAGLNTINENKSNNTRTNPTSTHLKVPVQKVPKLNLQQVFAEALKKKLEKDYDFVDFKQSNNQTTE